MPRSYIKRDDVEVFSGGGILKRNEVGVSSGEISNRYGMLKRNEVGASSGGNSKCRRWRTEIFKGLLERLRLGGDNDNGGLSEG